MPKSVHSDRYATLRAFLIETRKAAGLTQVELAARLGTPQSYVSKVERGERRMDLVEFVDFAEATGDDPSDLLRRWLASPRT